MTRLSFALAVAIALWACSSPPAIIPTKNLERPSDMAFVCLGLNASDNVVTGQPMAFCHTRNATDPPVNLSARKLGTFAFITDTVRGELAVADMDLGRLLDLSPELAGYGTIPVGGDPESLTASQDGCFVATANRTSCDVTLIDPSRLLLGTFSTKAVPVLPATGAGQAYKHLVVQTTSGKALSASLGEIAFLPPAQTSTVCQGSAPAQAIATFPGCDLVALLDLSFENGTATIASSYYVRPAASGGSQSAGGEPVCPTDCLPDKGAVQTLVGDAGVDAQEAAHGEVVDGGAVQIIGAPSLLQPIVVVPDGSRVYVGGLADTAITSLDITPGGLVNPIRTELAENPSGVSRLRLGIDPYLSSTTTDQAGNTHVTQGQFLSTRGKFLYAFAGDNSIRVLELSGAAPQECDVNILASPDQKTVGCFPVGTKPRRPLAPGPGIYVPNISYPNSPGPMPRDVAFADLETYSGNANYQSLTGQFGFVLASNGQVYALNLAPNDSETAVTETHSFRESRDVGNLTRTPIATSIAPQRSTIVTDQAFATASNLSAQDGPLIKPFITNVAGVATTTWFDYPDPDSIVSRIWDVTWEGVLPQTSRETGLVQGAPDGAAGVVSDAGADFCDSGVQAGDVLMFQGCGQNSDCQPDDKFSCQVTVSGGRGVCLPIDTAASNDIQTKCQSFLSSRMRYEVSKVTSTSLVLGLKLDEVPKTTLNPCSQDSDCQPDAEHGRLPGESADGGVGSGGFQCLQVHPSDFRCVKKCLTNSDCRTGNVCASVPGVLADIDNLCVEAPLIDATCLPQPMTRYRVHANQSYVVYGSSLPTLHPFRAATDGTCIPNPAVDPSLVARIPLSAPRCPASFLANASATKPVQTLPAQPESNPCLYFGSDLPLQGADGDDAVVNAGGATGDKHIRAYFQNPQIRFVINNLDGYAADLLSIHFEFQYGFQPLVVQIPSYEVLLTMGTRIFTGPTKTPESPILQNPPRVATSYPYLYVVDQGRTALTPASRGQVLRINPRSGTNEIAAFDATLTGNTPFQLQ